MIPDDWPFWLSAIVLGACLLVVWCALAAAGRADEAMRGGGA